MTERWVGTVRRECTDWLLIHGETISAEEGGTWNQSRIVTEVETEAGIQISLLLAEG
ncbi:hypothetical protein ACIBI9_20485 [Nonomuraea sp. NPDC050451]|uniref:hypothetical protein n=1 Tax=Nonomuraea sp. NPDC050451 TaxID=3364364 RepID=UPI0037BBE134